MLKKQQLVQWVLFSALFLFQANGSFAQTDPKLRQQPNILVIMTDQQFADAMSCVMGDQYLYTPNMDQLAAEGVMFTRAYSPNPLCKPMRSSMMTGRFPHEIGVLSNSNAKIDPTKNVFLGRLFKDGGYETAYYGKWHVAMDSDLKDIHGFDTLVEKPGRLDANPVVSYLNQEHKKPFLAVASFLSPHEICQWARFEEVPGWPIGETPQLDQLPPLKINAAPPENETDIMKVMRKSYHNNRRFPVGNYTEFEWRRLAWGYYRLIERADDFVGEIMEALKISGLEENTLVLFLSDHGDCCGSHLWNQKTVFYDESTRVPFILRWKGKTGGSSSDVLLNTGTDIIPTLCDFAGINVPSTLPGKSLKAAVLGEDLLWRRNFVVSENHMVQGDPVNGLSPKPRGWMVRSERYKYCLYSVGEQRESLVDMNKDPLEMVNVAGDPEYQYILNQHREYLRQHSRQYYDRLAVRVLDDLTPQ